jgi:hypothetical protein
MPELDVRPSKMDYWKNPVKYLLATLAAFTAYFLLAWALPNEERKVDGHIFHYPALIAQPFAGLAIILSLKTVLSVIAEVSIWRILRRSKEPLSNPPGKRHTSERATARRPGIGTVKKTDRSVPEEGLDENG